MLKLNIALFAALLADGVAASPLPGQTVGQVAAIPTVTIAPGVELPMAGLGTWLYNNTRAKAAVKAALEIGYTHIDTAWIYGNQVGVGEALKESGRARSSYFITTKIPGGLNASYTQTMLDDDLTQLGLDYVDLMLVHYPCTMDAHAAGGKESRQTMWRVMELFVKDKKARAIGVSHYCKRHLNDVLEIATIPIAVNQVQFHVGMGEAGPNATDDKAFCKSKGILYEGFSPLCGPCTDANGNPDRTLLNGPLVTKIGANHGKSGAQVSLRWQVQMGIPVIPKTDNPAHLRENIDLFDWELTDNEMAQLTAASTPAVAGNPGPPATSGDCSIV